MKFDSSMIAVLLALMAPPLAVLLAVAWERSQRKQIEKPPQSEKLLRPPGYSLSIRHDRTFDLVMDCILTASALSAISSAGVIALAGFLGAHAPVLYVVLCLLAVAPFVAGSIWAALRAFHLFREGQNIRLGLRGEQAVAEALGEAADSGFRAFHDLPAADNWNIDHVAIGKRGVFLIESKARRKRGGRNGQAAHEVIFDGETLQFPFGKDAKPIEQAKRNAAWLSDYLRNETGEPVEVFPLVVLHGWYVKTSAKGNFRVNVINANYLPGYLSRKGEKIEPAQVRRIITALDKKCRDVEF
jgi:hypothetical protein